MPNIVYETLPAKNGVDLSHECVYTLMADAEDEETFSRPDLLVTGKVTEAGTAYLYHSQTGEVEAVAWGRTPRDDHGHADVVVDIQEITLDHLRILWVGCDYGELPGAPRALKSSPHNKGGVISTLSHKRDERFERGLCLMSPAP